MTRIFDPHASLRNFERYAGDSTTDWPDTYLARSVAEIRSTGQICSPGCKVVAAIPAGAGDGLAATRLVDVAVALQQVGTLDELATTDEGMIVGTSTTSYRKGNVAIWTGYAIGPWHPSDIYTQGLGGSETAAWRLSEELAAMGWAVTLYGQFPEEGVFGDVVLRDFQTYDASKHLTAFVAFRNARVFDQYRPNADRTVLWLEDLAGAHSEGLTTLNAPNIDHICTVSHWHKQHMGDAYPWLDAGKIVACRNGIDHSFFQDKEIVREQRVVYSSSPDRGLDILLEIWPRVREAVPDAELISTYSRWYDIVAEANPVVGASRQHIVALLDQPGVKRLHGGLGQNALAKLMMSSKVWVHPSWYTVGDMQMHETSCISAMEAQAAGCVVVASNWGALSETVQAGTLVDGDPRVEGAWRDVFVQSIIAGLTDPHVQDRAALLGPEMMRDMGWFGAAEQLSALWVDP